MAQYLGQAVGECAVRDRPVLVFKGKLFFPARMDQHRHVGSAVTALLRFVLYLGWGKGAQTHCPASRWVKCGVCFTVFGVLNFLSNPEFGGSIFRPTHISRSMSHRSVR